MVPWLWYPSGLDTTYKYDGTRGVPVGAPIPFPDPALRGQPLFTGGASALSGKTPGGLRWQLKQGVPLVFDPNTGREETTPLGEIPSPLPSPARIGVSLTRPYPVNTPVVGRGNVGPWPRYDPSRDTAVVPYWAIIK